MKTLETQHLFVAMHSPELHAPTSTCDDASDLTHLMPPPIHRTSMHKHHLCACGDASDLTYRTHICVHIIPFSGSHPTGAARCAMVKFYRRLRIVQEHYPLQYTSYLQTHQGLPLALSDKAEPDATESLVPMHVLAPLTELDLSSQVRDFY